MRNIRYALRGFWHDRAFTATTVGAADAPRRHRDLLPHPATNIRRGCTGAAARLRLPRLRVLPGGRRRDDLDVCPGAGAPGHAHVVDHGAFEILPWTEAIALQRYPVMVASWIGLLLSGIALVLSISGLYGVITYGLSQRQNEIGIRIALGASSQAIVRLILSQSGRLVAIGAGIGLTLSFSVLGALRAMIDLKNFTMLDPGAFAAAVMVIALAAGVAAYIPSKRATRVDPSEALRTDR